MIVSICSSELHEDVPSDSWSLDQLGTFCQKRNQRMAVDAWLTGKALAVAKAKTKHGGFTAWKQRYGFKDATVSRYIRLFEAYDSPAALGKRGIMEALREAEIVKKPQPIKYVAVEERPEDILAVGRTRLPDEDNSVTVTNDTERTKPLQAALSWQADDDSDWAFDDSVDPYVPVSTKTTLEEEIAALPQALLQLADRVDWVVSQGDGLDELRRQITPASIMDASRRLDKSLESLVKVLAA